MSKAGPSGACLELIGNDRIRLVMSETVLAEIKDVISRPDLRELSVNLVDEKTEELIELILEKTEFVSKVYDFHDWPLIIGICKIPLCLCYFVT